MNRFLQKHTQKHDTLNWNDELYLGNYCGVSMTWLWVLVQRHLRCYSHQKSIIECVRCRWPLSTSSKLILGTFQRQLFSFLLNRVNPALTSYLDESKASDRKGERNKIKTTERKKEKEKKKSPNIFPLASICEAAPVSQVTRKDIPFSFSLISGDGNLLLSAAAVPFRHRVVNAQACICIDMCLLLLLYRRRMRRRSFFFSPLYIKE